MEWKLDRTKYQDVANEIVAILTKKGNDYGNDNGRNNLTEFGPKGILVRAYDKIDRLRTLVWDEKAPSVVDERVEDTWLDLAGYAILAVIMGRSSHKFPVNVLTETKLQVAAVLCPCGRQVAIAVPYDGHCHICGRTFTLVKGKYVPWVPVAPSEE